MLVTLLGITMLVKHKQPINVPYSMLVKPEGIVTFVMLLQQQNARDPMFATLLGIKILVRLLQYSNASFPILLRPSGSVTLVRPHS